MKCWIRDFKKYVTLNLKKDFPVSKKEDFINYLKAWIADEKVHSGSIYLQTKHFGLENDEIIFMKVTARSEVSRREPSEIKLPEYERWQGFVED